MGALLLLAAVSLLPGCVLGPNYPRFEEGAVLSLNPLYTAGSPPLTDLDLPNLEGSWSVTNKYERQRPVQGPELPQAGHTTNRLARPPALTPGPRGHDQNQQPVEVVTVLVFERGGLLGDHGDNTYRVTMETYAGGALEGRTAFFARPVMVKDSVFLDLVPNIVAHVAVVEQLHRQHYLPAHWLAKVEPQGQTLRIGRLNEQWLARLLKKKPRALRLALPWGFVLTNTDALFQPWLLSECGDWILGIVITDTPEAMQRFLRRHGQEPEAFSVTTFFRQGAGPCSPETLKQAVEQTLVDLAPAEIAKKLGKDNVMVQVGEIVNRTSEPIDTKFMDCVLQRHLNAESSLRLSLHVLNDYTYWFREFAQGAAWRMADVYLSGEIVKGVGQEAAQESARCSLRLTLRDKEGKVLWESEKPL